LVSRKEEDGADLPPLLIPELSGSPYFQLSISIVKLTSIIGQSIMGLSQSFLDFGRTVLVNERFERGFYLYNRSSKLPLEFSIECGKCNDGGLNVDDTTSEEELVVGYTEGVLEGYELVSGGGSSRDQYSSLWIPVSISATRFGLFSRDITIRNKNNSAQVLVVEIRLFLDSGSVAVTFDGDASSSSLVWDSLYSTWLEDSAYTGLELSSIDEKGSAQSFEIENLSGETLSLVPKSDMDISLHWSVSQSEEVNVEGSCGAVAHIDPGQKIIVFSILIFS
jgi:hypothetical protein